LTVLLTAYMVREVEVEVEVEVDIIEKIEILF
jgi:hypothetical protein